MVGIGPKTNVKGVTDPILTRIVEEDKVPWYKKPNLRSLYLLLLPTCIGIEMTSGFDSQIINAVQIVDQWQDCMSVLSYNQYSADHGSFQ
jgi:hypothetical protein